MRRIAEIGDSRLDTTHPPTSYRIALLLNRPREALRITAAGDAMNTIDEKLVPQVERAEQTLLNAYRSILYD